MPDPRAEAFERVGGRFDARVLEPSPPAVHVPPWYADDPVSPEPRRAGLPVLSPVPNADLTWDELAGHEPDLRAWCAERWLGAWRPLPPLPAREALATTRDSWHALAEHVFAPARRAACGKIGLRFTFDGFGTPFFGADEQLRVECGDFVVQRAGREARSEISTVAAAASAAGVAPGALHDLYHPATRVRDDEPLAVDQHAARALADWFGFACSVLDELRAEFHAVDTRTQLWPEHFDLAIEVGSAADGTRGSFGASPGDAAHPEPYLYVTHWAEKVPADPFWNDHAFHGGSLSYATLLAATSQRERALAFFREGVRILGVNNG